MKKLLKNLVKFAAYGSLTLVGAIVILFFIVDPAEAEEVQPPTEVQQQPTEQVAATSPSKEQMTVAIVTDPIGLTVELGDHEDFRERTVEETPFEVKLEAGEEVTYTVWGGETTRRVTGTLTAPEIDGQTVSIWVDRKTIAEMNLPKLEEAKIDVSVTCKQLVEDNLLAPSTAKFGGGFNEVGGYQINSEEGVALYKAYVDAQNGFGAMIRNDFACQYTLSTDMVELLYLN